MIAALPAMALALLQASAPDLCAGDTGRSVAKDFGQFCVYHADNQRIVAERRRVRMVFMGD